MIPFLSFPFLSFQIPKTELDDTHRLCQEGRAYLSPLDLSNQTPHKGKIQEKRRDEGKKKEESAEYTGHTRVCGVREREGRRPRPALSLCEVK